MTKLISLWWKNNEEPEAIREKKVFWNLTEYHIFVVKSETSFAEKFLPDMFIKFLHSLDSASSKRITMAPRMP